MISNWEIPQTYQILCFSLAASEKEPRTLPKTAPYIANTITSATSGSQRIFSVRINPLDERGKAENNSDTTRVEKRPSGTIAPINKLGNQWMWNTFNLYATSQYQIMNNPMTPTAQYGAYSSRDGTRTSYRQWALSELNHKLHICQINHPKDI